MSRSTEPHAESLGLGYLRLVGLGAALGVPAALPAALFLALVHTAEDWLWDDLPDALGHTSPPWYLVVGLPVAGALVVVGARRWLPGNGGATPLEGLKAHSTPLAEVPGVVLAALGSLPFGAVLGPEMPVIAVGSAVGTMATRFVRLDARGTAVVSNAGVFSAVSALFGGPLVAGMLVVEGSLGLGAGALPTLLPGFVAAAVGYLIFVGFGTWGGLNAPGLVVPDLPTYDGTRLADLVVAVAVGVLVAVGVAVARRIAVEVAGLDRRLGMAALLVAGGLVVGLLAQFGEALGAGAEDILFSGQTSVSVVVGEDSSAVVVVLMGLKLLAYAVCLGCGFRGGPIFPAVFTGVALASLGVVWFDVSPTLAVAVGSAAGMAAQTRLLVSPLVFAALLVGAAGTEAVPAAVLAVTAAWLTTTALQARATDVSAD